MTFDFFTYAGAPGAYNLALGGGAGVYWQTEGGFSVSTSYLSDQRQPERPQQVWWNEGWRCDDRRCSCSATTQIAYAPENWGIAAAYT